MANLNLQDKKFITPENLKLIINYGLGFASRVKNLEDKEIAPFEADKLYTKDSLTIYDGYIYKAKATNQSSTFNEIYWDKIGDDITELTKDDIRDMLGLSDEELETLSKIILDSEVRLDKTYSSSKIYTDIQNAIDTAKAYTLTELGKISGASYKVVTATSEMTSEKIIYLLDNSGTFDMYIVEEDGNPTKIGDTTINLTDYLTVSDADSTYLKIVNAESTYAKITGLDNHTSDTDIHVTTTDKTKWDKVTDKVDTTDFETHTGDTDIHTSATEKASYVKKTDITTTIDSTSTDEQVVSAKLLYDEFKNQYLETISDCNDDLENNKVYIVIPSTLNKQEKVNYGLLVNYRFFSGNSVNGDWRRQILFPSYSGEHKDIYVRFKTNNADWSNWCNICITAVSDVAETKVTLKSGFNGNVFYRIVNGICYVTGQGVYASIIPSYEAPICNLPKCSLSSCHVRGVYNGQENKDESNINVVYIDGYTTILRGHFVSNKRTWFSFSYPVAES